MVRLSSFWAWVSKNLRLLKSNQRFAGLLLKCRFGSLTICNRLWSWIRTKWVALRYLESTHKVVGTVGSTPSNRVWQSVELDRTMCWIWTMCWGSSELGLWPWKMVVAVGLARKLCRLDYEPAGVWILLGRKSARLLGSHKPTLKIRTWFWTLDAIRGYFDFGDVWYRR